MVSGTPRRWSRERRLRWLIRVSNGAADLQVLAVTGITTVLLTRAYLAAAGYPQVGGGSLHIGHVLWGGLLMLAGLATALLFTGIGARWWTALLGGVGLGLFVDEVGKYLTRTNDYFYRPAAAIIYFVFAGLLMFASWQRGRTPTTPRLRTADAAAVAVDGIASGLTDERRRAALALLDDRDDETTAAVRTLLRQAPVRSPGMLRRLARLATTVAARLADLRGSGPVMVTLFALSTFVVTGIFVGQTLYVATGHHLSAGTETWAVAAGAVTRTASTVLVILGLLRIRQDPTAAYHHFRLAVLVNLVLTQIFNFDDSQFRAVAELPFQLLFLAFASHRARQHSVRSDVRAVGAPRAAEQ